LKRLFRGLCALLGLVIYVAFMTFIFWITVKHLALINPSIALDTIIYRIFSTVIVLVLIKTSKNFSYALPWIMIILMFPVVGTILYIILRKKQKK